MKLLMQLQTGEHVVDSTSGLRPVVITRPLAQAQLFAQRFASQLAAQGREAVLLPLLEIAPVSDPAPLQAALASLERYALVVFVSPNAIDALFALRDAASWPAGLAIGVVGEGSRLALQRHGLTSENTRIFAPRDTARMDSEELFKALELDSLRGRSVLIVRGQAGRDFLTDMLRAEQVMVDHVTAYQRLQPQLTAALKSQLQDLLSVESEWIMTSSEALRYLLVMTQEALGSAGVAKLLHKKCIVSHHRIAETAQSLGFLQVVMSGSGDERLIAALQSPA